MAKITRIDNYLDTFIGRCLLPQYDQRIVGRAIIQNNLFIFVFIRPFGHFRTNGLTKQGNISLFIKCTGNNRYFLHSFILS